MKAPETFEIPLALQSKLEEFRARLWSVKIGEGALAGITGLIASFLIIFLLDRFFDAPHWLRWLIMTAGFAIPAIGIPFQYHRWVWQKRTLGQIARVLRKRYPRLGDELLGIVDLASDKSTRHSQALVEAAMTQVAEKVKERDFSDAVPANFYRKWLIASLSLGLPVILAVIVVEEAAQSSVARWMTPWRLVERYTFAKLRPVSDELIVPYAEPFDFSTQLQDNTEWKPDSASLRLPGRTRLEVDKDNRESYEFQIPPQKDADRITVRVGDARETISLKPLSRPELNQLSAKLRLPDYLMYHRDPVIPVRGSSIDLIEGSTVSFLATASRKLEKATVNGLPAAISGDSFSTRPELVEESTSRVFRWNDQYGLTAKEDFELKINAITDAAPEIFAKKISPEQVVLEDEVVTFDLTSSDDYGIREVGLEWSGIEDPVLNQDPAIGGKMVASGEPEKLKVEARGTFSAARYQVRPQTLEVRAYAEDFYPNRERIYSQTFVLHIMAPSDHANWLTKEFGNWFSRAREVYEREQQLHETNRQLFALSPEELDRPENRRRLEQQASSEASNARRLEALTRHGRDLIRQAAKNDEFDADRLESWAQMMRSLDEISKDKMPSVAELLKKASQSPGSQSKSGESQEAAESGKQEAASSAPQVGGENSEKSQPDAKGKGEEKAEPQGPQTPSINDRESGFNEEQANGKESQGGAPSEGALSLPQTTLSGESGENGDDSGEKEDLVSPARENLEKAMDEQRKLLEEFARVTEELQQILSSLEASTFVKRLKAASRKQLDIAKNLNATITGGFGMPRDLINAQLQEVAVSTSQIEKEESEKLYNIQADLDAYYQRKQENIYKNVLEQMRSTEVVTQLKKIGEDTAENLSGRSIAAAEFWADTLDRWAEELVSASQSQQQQGDSNQSRKSLPPETVLEVMKIAKGQMDLREETRELDAVQPSLSPNDYGGKAKAIEIDQSELRARVDEVVLDILDLPSAEENFPNELKLLNFVSDVMRQARGVLARPDTGPEVVAAQTEAIELLLQSNRQPSGGGGGGGGGGGSQGGGGSGGTGGALSDIELSPGRPAAPVSSSKRSVGQATGKAGSQFPEEFRNGLDSYFNKLEKIR